MSSECPFCSETSAILENELAFTRKDLFPVSEGHTLIISKRHVANYFQLTKDEQISILDLLNETKENLDKEFKPDGYNIGVNVNESAGQTVHHVHIHIIPRYTGDVSDPRGGVRGVIPTKKNYL